MAKAIIGSTVDARTFVLLEEVRALRSRVAELETALAEAESALEDVSEEEHVVDLDDSEVSALNALA